MLGMLLTMSALTVLAQPIPEITQQPQSQIVVAGTNVSFSVAATGQSPFTYQWIRNGSPLADGGRISGAQSSQPLITGVVASDTADYRVTVYDRQFDSAQSAPATLTVRVPPTILALPLTGLTFWTTDASRCGRLKIHGGLSWKLTA